jgi:uncharacterized protein YprB with RNaseH-like and TPR domain
MDKIPITRMRKSEIIWMAKHRCQAHRHTYLEHYNCFLKEHPDTKRFGYIDIETTDFKADWGVMLCYVIQAQDGTIYEDRIQFKDLRNKKIMDKKVVQTCVDAMSNFDILVGYYHSNFDLKFIRTRAVSLGVKFPFYDEIHQKDVYYMVRNRFQLTRNSLKNACATLLGHSDKTPLERSVWRSAILCEDEKAMEYILKHCRFDVSDVRKLYEKVCDYSQPREASI